MLVLAPAACCLGAIAISSGLTVLSSSTKSVSSEEPDVPDSGSAKRKKSKRCVH